MLVQFQLLLYKKAGLFIYQFNHIVAITGWFVIYGYPLEEERLRKQGHEGMTHLHVCSLHLVFYQLWLIFSIVVTCFKKKAPAVRIRGEKARFSEFAGV